MAWPWEFVHVDSNAKELRRQTLDRYAGYAQISAFGPVFLVLIYRLALWTIKTFDARKAVYSAVPESPRRKIRRQSPLGAWEARYRLFLWWLGGDVVFLGQSVGIIGISQLPLQYLLALKSLNPIAYVLNSSHEEINRFHRALGRIVYVLLFLHACLYTNYFIQTGIFLEKLMSSRAVQTGLLGIWAMTFLGATALKAIRQYSYRIFFITHLAVALIIPPLIWFHVRVARVFVVEALVVFLVDIISRKLDTITTTATIEQVAGTSLVKVTTSIPHHKIDRFRKNPGSHIYLQIPGESRPSSQDPLSKEYLVHEFLMNPFTVAAVDEDNSELTLVARHLDGPTTSTLRQLADQKTRAKQHQTSLAIEGPYGVAANYRKLSSGEYDRVLLVSGGVGATFTVPLYRSLVVENPGAKVQLVWAMRSPREAAWANAASREGRVFSAEDGVQLFVTGSKSTPGAQEGDGGDEDGVELSTMQGEQQQHGVRPDLRKIVDDVFRHGHEERVAVLFCGPANMGRDLRNHVGVWVKKGRVVFWHSESFEW
ncbi:hypothetical protein M406DRAFT_262963 [Cryphonectria parasitica EP155]|uniref:FAD-binding FR-type domain-containing protein n=1 Tax=Cryphonectria parasitica (strain ATCC 38755 / EP155) TaxID=660469 RepID=A0A9P5CN15_CRYP1|nr:uncharacterized protein M406DRAFT_262963 [Cryphonectria parasitica EP155]KAF3763656.1 hypothetical protein M406DRAFT_262963 [Cryphonectria parasitica EP155]